MNNRVNYGLVGFIVFIGIVLMVGFTFWLLKPTANEDIKTYSISFDESVLGLNIDAPVKYRGLSVGKVSKIRINPHNEEQVEVLINILNTTPIKDNIVAKLTAQGITGLSYINLSVVKPEKIKAFTYKSKEYPSIHTQPSFMNNLESSIGTVSTGLNDTLLMTQRLLNKENQEQFSKLLKNTANMMNKMDIMLDEDTVKHIQSSVKNLDEFSGKLNKITPNIDNFIDKSVIWEDKISTSFESIMNSYVGIRGSMDEIKRAISSGEFNIKEISGDIIPTINTTLVQMQDLMIKVDETLEHHNRSPSDILFKQEELRKGPGEI